MESTRGRSGPASRALIDAAVLAHIRAHPGDTRDTIAATLGIKPSRVESAVARLRSAGDVARCGELVPRIGKPPRCFDTLAEHLYRWIADVGGTGPEYAATVGETVRRVCGVRGTLSCLGLVEPHGTLWTPGQVAARREDARWALRGWP